MTKAIAALLFGLSIPCLAPQATAEESGGIGFIELHRTKLVDADHLEVVMGLVQRNEAYSGTRHYHPGGEFGFVVEGEITIETKSGQLILGSGDNFYQPPGEWHVVSTNQNGAKTVVFRIFKKDQPMVVPSG